ncbi:MAG TPA: 50S ribosomal protein L15 [Rhizomicrobium sp.]|nr:50S ribosomal protein L15 [Rhizomicrobium sp.]
MKLNQLSDNAGSRKARMRVGRGIGSGKGKTAGRGGKGQTARTGVHIKGFEGGQMPLHMRMPKRGFNNIFRRDFVEVNLGQLQTAIDAGRLDAAQPINGDVLQKAGVLRRLRDGVRLLGKGEIKSKITVEVAGASKSAIAAVEKAGGQVVLPPPAPAPAAKA